MIKKKIGKVQFLFFPHFASHRKLLHAISTRDGGVSSNCYTSLNLSFQVGDEFNNVVKNYQILSHTLGFDLHSLITCQQIHQDRITLIDESYLKKNCYLPGNAILNTDALVTNVPGMTLMTQHADCVPLFLYDPHTHTIAVAHAGWKGTLARIGQKTVEVLANEYRCQPYHLLAALGPSIGPCCYQINSTMAHRVLHELPHAHEWIRESPDGNPFFNLWQANKMQLQEAGIKDEQLFCTQLCTSCNVDLLFSYRKEKGKTGRFGAIIGLTK